MSVDPTRLPIGELQRLLRSRELSATELLAAHTKRIEAVDGRVKAFLRLTPELATEQAAAADQAFKSGDAGPLTGIPLAVKDVLCVRGVETTAGSQILRGFRPPYTGTAVSRLFAAGAVMLGVTNCDEFAMGSSTENSGYFPTHNPWGLDRVPGGSSGGSAAAVAAGEAVIGLGTDTGGSIRQPAALCGVVGMKPTYGRVSRYGLIAFASSLDQIGPFARSVEDAAIVLQAIAGHDPLDATSSDHSNDVRTDFDAGVRGMKLGVPREYSEVEGMEPGVKAALDRALQALQGAGAELVDVNLPHTDYGLAAYYIIAPAECSSNLARFDGVRYGLSDHDAANVTDAYMQTRRTGFGTEVRRRVMLGTYALSSGYYDAYYLKAQKVRTLIKRDFDSAFEKCDAIVSATSPTVAFPIGSKTQDPLSMYLCDVLTLGGNLAGLPGISLPCGMSENLPVGLQVLAPQERSEGRGGAYWLISPPRLAGRRALINHWGPRALARERPGGDVQLASWDVVIGMEVHVQPRTRSKMFCGCAVGQLGDPPNSNVCEICTGMPGVLPVINKAAVEACLKTALALNCEIPRHTKFDRKNYMYPDLPKGYQISQYDLPMSRDGFIDLGDRRVRIRRVHLEEDTGKLIHAGDKLQSAKESFVDLNRAGVPLMEIVSEPDLSSADEARDYAVALRTLLRTIGASEAEMEKGQLRAEPNISIRRTGSDELGVKTELKNINSFRALHRAILFEVTRQIEVLESGGIVTQETRGWSETEQRTFSQRSKEFAEDYRYFPEPDLPPLELDPAWIEELRHSLPELPGARYAKLVSQYGLPASDATLLAADRELADFFESVVKSGADAKQAANWTIGVVAPSGKRPPAGYLADIIKLVVDGKITRDQGREVLAESSTTGTPPVTIVNQRGFAQVSDESEIQAIVEAVMAANPRAVEDYRAGKKQALSALMADVKAKAPQTNPKVASDLLRNLLG